MKYLYEIIKLLFAIPLLIVYTISFGAYSFHITFPDNSFINFNGWLF